MVLFEASKYGYWAVGGNSVVLDGFDSRLYRRPSPPVPLSQFRSDGKAVLAMGEGEPMRKIFLVLIQVNGEKFQTA
jgi:hypothetical protein